jgi:hypothetical protein
MEEIENYKTNKRSTVLRKNSLEAFLTAQISTPNNKSVGSIDSSTINLSNEELHQQNTISPLALRDVSLELFFSVTALEEKINKLPKSRMGLRDSVSEKTDATGCLGAAREAIRIGSDFAFYAPVEQELDITRKQWAVQVANLSEDLCSALQAYIDEKGQISKDNGEYLGNMFGEVKKALRILTTNLCMTIEAD